jgi:hypothetical protein
VATPVVAWEAVGAVLVLRQWRTVVPILGGAYLAAVSVVIAAVLSTLTGGLWFGAVATGFAVVAVFLPTAMVPIGITILAHRGERPEV